MYSFVRRMFGARAAPGPTPPPAGVLFRPHSLTRAFSISGPDDDRSVLEELRHSHEFEPHVVGLLAKLIPPDATILDVGANVGALSVVFAELAPRGQVYAFEASELAYRHLLETIEANGVTNVVPVPKAVFDRSGQTLSLNSSSASLAGSFIDPSGGAGELQPIVTVSIDDWVRERRLSRLDFVKMDIEGSELFALAGAGESLARFGPDLLIECNAVVTRRLHRRSYADLFAALTRHYTHIYALPDRFRDGTVVPLANTAQLGALLELGRGNEDLFCTRSTAPPLPMLEFEAWRQQLAESMGGQRIVIEPDFEIVASRPRIEASAGDTVHLGATLRNRGPQVLSSAGPYPTNACYHVRAGDSVVVFDGLRTALPRPVARGEDMRFEIGLVMPAEPGQYTFDLTLVQEGIAWLDQLHVPVTSVPVQVHS